MKTGTQVQSPGMLDMVGIHSGSETCSESGIKQYEWPFWSPGTLCRFHILLGCPVISYYVTNKWCFHYLTIKTLFSPLFSVLLFFPLSLLVSTAMRVWRKHFRSSRRLSQLKSLIDVLTTHFSKLFCRVWFDDVVIIGGANSSDFTVVLFSCGWHPLVLYADKRLLHSFIWHILRCG